MDHLKRSLLNCFVSMSIDRVTDKRSDDNWIENALKKKSTYFVPVWRSKNLLTGNIKLSPVFLGFDEIKKICGKNVSPVLLGELNNKLYFAIELPAVDSSIPEKLKYPGQFQDLRLAGSQLENNQASLLAYARAITYWHRHNLFCTDCGSRTESSEGGHQLTCTNEKCRKPVYPRTDPAVIVLVTYQDRCLLGRKQEWPKGMYSTLAGFVEPGESIENAVVREVFEESGIKTDEVVYHSSQPWPFPSSVMLGFTARAINDKIKIDNDELEDARWFSREDIFNSLKNQKIHIPIKVSIAYRLIETWFNLGTFGDLKDIVNTSF